VSSTSLPIWWADVPAKQHDAFFIKAGTEQIWIAKIGDLKSLVIPLEFFSPKSDVCCKAHGGIFL
jgi:hypothetical protein